MKTFKCQCGNPNCKVGSRVDISKTKTCQCGNPNCKIGSRVDVFESTKLIVSNNTSKKNK